MTAHLQSGFPVRSTSTHPFPRITNLFLFKRSNGIWYIHYRQNGITKWKSTKSRSKSDALRVLTEFETLLQEKPIPSRSIRTFQADILRYAEVNRSASTVEIIKRSFHHLASIKNIF